MPLIASSTLVYAYAGALLSLAYCLATAPVALLTSPAILIVGESMRIPPASFQPAAARLAKGLPALSVQSTQLLALVGLALACHAVAHLLAAGGLAVPASVRVHEYAKFVKDITKTGDGDGRPTVAADRAARIQALRAQRGEELHTLVAAQTHFLNLALVHVLAAGGLCAWIYILHSGRSELFFSSAASSSSSAAAASLLAAPAVGGLAVLGDLLANQVVFSAALLDMLFWGYLWTVVREERREAFASVQQIQAQEDDEEEERRRSGDL